VVDIPFGLQNNIPRLPCMGMIQCFYAVSIARVLTALGTMPVCIHYCMYSTPLRHGLSARF
jgi:hypothetical protein